MQMLLKRWTIRRRIRRSRQIVDNSFWHCEAVVGALGVFGVGNRLEKGLPLIFY